MKTSKLDAFDAMLTAFRAIYDAEIGRLADRYRARILDGEFSGDTPPPNDGPRFLALAEELEKTHPWLATQRKRVMVVGAAHWWLEKEEAAMTDPKTGVTLAEGVELEQGEVAAECMAHDILAVAAGLGWVKPMRFLNDDAYALRVRKGRAA